MASMERDVNQIEVQKPTKTTTHATSSSITFPKEVATKELKDIRRLLMDFKRDMSRSKSPKPTFDPKHNPTQAIESKKNIAKQVSYDDDDDDDDNDDAAAADDDAIYRRGKTSISVTKNEEQFLPSYEVYLKVC